MPTYQYRCTECGEDLEAVQKFSDAPLSTCPACGGRLRKVFNAVGVVFKGSGFYRTDSRNGSANGDGDSRTSEKKSAAETKSADKEPAASGSAGSNGSNKGNSNKDSSNKDNSNKGRQAVSSGTSSTGQKTTSS